MKKFFVFLFLCASLWGKININDATRYELMTIGGLDAGRADMLINYRKSREITDENQLKNITGFGGYDTTRLAQNFDLQALPKPQPAPEPKKESEQNIIIIQPEKRVYVNHPPRYRYEQNFGNGITIIEEGNLRRRPLPPRYEEHRGRRFGAHEQNRVAKPAPVPQHLTTQRAKSSQNNCVMRNGICISGEVRARGVWR